MNAHNFFSGEGVQFKSDNHKVSDVVNFDSDEGEGIEISVVLINNIQNEKEGKSFFSDDQGEESELDAKLIGRNSNRLYLVSPVKRKATKEENLETGGWKPKGCCAIL